LGGGVKEMITHCEALELLEKYNCNNFILEHSFVVNKFAVELTKKLKSKGIKIDVDLVDIGSLLHDIGMSKTGIGGKEDHVIIGKKIVEKEGIKEISKIVGNQGLFSIFNENKLKTWEEKIVLYSDKRVEKDKVVDLNEGLENLKRKHPKYKELIRKANPLLKNLEKEIMEVLK